MELSEMQKTRPLIRNLVRLRRYSTSISVSDGIAVMLLYSLIRQLMPQSTRYLPLSSRREDYSLFASSS